MVVEPSIPRVGLGIFIQHVLFFFQCISLFDRFSFHIYPVGFVRDYYSESRYCISNLNTLQLQIFNGSSFTQPPCIIIDIHVTNTIEMQVLCTHRWVTWATFWRALKFHKNSRKRMLMEAEAEENKYKFFCYFPYSVAISII